MSDRVAGAALLDVNVLIALFDPAHPHHDEAHTWLASRGRKRIATCPITLSGCIRIMSDARYPSFVVTPSEIAERLRVDLCTRSNHEFWADDMVPFDPRIFVAENIDSPRKITDVYLLALAVQHDGCLATFDRSIPLRAVRGTNAGHLRVLGVS